MQILYIKYHKCQVYIALETRASIFTCLLRHWSVNAKRITSCPPLRMAKQKLHHLTEKRIYTQTRRRNFGESRWAVNISKSNLPLNSHPVCVFTLAKSRHVAVQPDPGWTRVARAVQNRKAHHAKVICRTHVVNAGQILTISYFRRPSV